MSETQLEIELGNQLKSKTGEPIEQIDCQDGGEAGDRVICDIEFSGGTSQPISVDLLQVNPKVRVEIGLVKQ